MTALDSGFHSEDSGLPGTGFQSLSVELGFWIPVVRGIPGSWSRIPDSKTNFRDSGFHKQKFLGFRYP